MNEEITKRDAIFNEFVGMANDLLDKDDLTIKQENMIHSMCWKFMAELEDNI